ncbi:oligosaccharide flippase family protein [Faecalicatena contorta]|uniref:lipopolysaccharide biosynthesis protein n=1 Tax=Faecalicatena contorta TaxID=39482 RepID=UPI001961C520|nr:oligosaccharide flippase family protein [Faecalicatena contorta]MBM6685025.1 oligosaccharide flippase family protein [Faecalicatena contorta]MBM6710553.1 oligosaccharide flippase family protein [Faecalicatena contorta]
MLEKIWTVKEKNIQKSSVFWNMMSSGINSVVSMFLLLIVTRLVGVAEAGIFSLGFSTSQMMLTIGNYGMRNYQVTDLNNKYSMKEYLSSRILTTILMMLIVVVFIFAEGYFWEKALVTILLCLLKVTDAFDDVYGGYYQKNGRLDISGKLMTIRIVFYVIIFCVILFLCRNLIAACVGAIISSTVSLCMLVYSTKGIFKLEGPQIKSKKIFCLLKDSFPLCISAFLLIYMGNAPKYAIDAFLSDVSQACYNYLFMPCFVINLFVGFALQPLLVGLSRSWLHGEYKKFLKLCGLILGGAVAIALLIIYVGRNVGCQILSVVFGIELMQYKDVLTILLVGGAFFAFAVIEQVILTVMRRQVYLLVGFGMASLTAFLVSDFLVSQMGLLGAGWTYTVAAGVLFLIQAILIWIFYRRRRR